MNDSALSFKSAGALLKETASEWIEDNALRLSAALAYYSTFSIAPLVVIALAIAGWVFGRDAANGLLDQQLHSLLGGATAEHGVIDGFGRVLSHPGLHVVDGAAVGANLGVNPSLTIAAVAERCADKLVARGPALGLPSPPADFQPGTPQEIVGPRVIP